MYTDVADFSIEGMELTELERKLTSCSEFLSFAIKATNNYGRCIAYFEGQYIVGFKAFEGLVITGDIFVELGSGDEVRNLNFRKKQHLETLRIL